MNYRIIFLLSAALSLVCLFVPFVWMKIGPLGRQYYGPTVPDVYIYGGTITGKDTAFWAIGFAVAFQAIFILAFSVLSTLSYFLKKRVLVVFLLFFQSALLALFPIWLKIYLSGVLNNSDAADITVHYQYGMTLYYILAVCNGLGWIVAFRSKELK